VLVSTYVSLEKVKVDICKLTGWQHADRALELLEVLWGRQHRYGVKYDWRQVQTQMGIQVYVSVSYSLVLK
jgi:hypothetical protein